jgi:hypothetical protein
MAVSRSWLNGVREYRPQPKTLTCHETWKSVKYNDKKRRREEKLPWHDAVEISAQLLTLNSISTWEVSSCSSGYLNIELGKSCLACR